MSSSVVAGTKVISQEKQSNDINVLLLREEGSSPSEDRAARPAALQGCAEGRSQRK